MIIEYLYMCVSKCVLDFKGNLAEIMTYNRITEVTFCFQLYNLIHRLIIGTNNDFTENRQC